MKSSLLPGLFCTLFLTGCAARETDEQRIRQHYGIPPSARTVQSQVMGFPRFREPQCCTLPLKIAMTHQDDQRRLVGR
jgi:hypothetical protein